MEVILTSVAVVVVVVVVAVAEVISTGVAVTVGRGGDYLDTGSSRKRVSREISCSESVLWTTNCPLVLAYSGLGDSGHFQWSLYTFRIQSVLLLFIKYTHDYPHPPGFPSLILNVLPPTCYCSYFFISVYFQKLWRNLA